MHMMQTLDISSIAKTWRLCFQKIILPGFLKSRDTFVFWKGSLKYMSVSAPRCCSDLFVLENNFSNADKSFFKDFLQVFFCRFDVL